MKTAEKPVAGMPLRPAEIENTMTRNHNAFYRFYFYARFTG